MLRLVDVMNLGRDTYELEDAGGRPLGTLRREWTMFTKRITFLPADGGEGLEVRGNFWGYDYEILVNNEPVAQISQKWQGLRALFAHRYAVAFGPVVGARLRQVILGTVIAIDLMKAKDRRSAASSNT